MKNYLTILLTIITLSMFTNSCKKENIDKDAIRPLTELTTVDIPTFEGMTQKKNGEIPHGVIKILDIDYTAEFEFRWESDDGNFAYIDIRVMESHEFAIEALLDAHKYYSNPFIAESEDDPAVVGNISYMQGREFIRDNLIIKINTSEKFDDLVTEIAKYIDSKILKSPSFISISQVKPVIKDFKINKNPVVEQSQTPLTIQIDDPNDKEFVYQWRFSNNPDYGGITKNDSGIYYYISSWFYPTNCNIGLTLIAINEYGFCADSTINIQIVEQ